MDYHAYQDNIDQMFYSEEKPETLNEHQIDHLRDHFFGVLEKLYGLQHLSVDELEFNLDEMAFILGMKLPKGKIHISRKNNNDIYNFAELLVQRKYM